MGNDAFAGEPFWNQETDAPVAGGVVSAIQFRLNESTQCVARGVMLMDDGSVYTWTVRREGHADMAGRRRLATPMRGTFRDVAAGLLEFERDYIDADMYRLYADKVSKIDF